MTGSTQKSEEIFQEVMLTMIKKIDHYSLRSDLQNSFKAWIFRIAKNLAIDENNGFKIVLSRKTMEVEQIFYPRLDPLADDGKMEDLFPKGRIILTHDGNKVKIKKVKMGTLD